jgi:hypothetical protein
MKETEHGDECCDTEPFRHDIYEHADYFSVYVRSTYDQPLLESGADWDITEEYDYPTLEQAEAKREELEKKYT